MATEELDPLSPEPRYLQVAGIIRRAIERGELESGQAIPSQTSLMQRYGIARMTASKAVAVLVREDLVVIVPGMGAYVKRR